MKTLKYCSVILFFFFFKLALIANPNLGKIIFDQGMELYMKRDFKGAAQYFGQVVDMDPYNYHARYYYAVSLSARGNARKALEQVKNLRQAFPQEQAYIKLEQDIVKQMTPVIKPPKKADSHAQKSRKTISSTTSDTTTETSVPKKPTVVKKSSPQIDKIRDLIDEGMFTQAEAIAMALLKTEPKNHEIYSVLGFSAFIEKNYQKAIESLLKSLELGSKDFEPYFLLGSSYMALKQDKAAISYFQKALSIDSNDIFTKQYLADLYLKDGKYNEAEKLFKEVLQIDSEILDAEIGLAEINFEKGFIDEAVQKINLVLSRNQDNSRAHYLKARALLENKLYAEAIEEANLAYELDADRAEYLVFKSLVKIKNFQIQEALEELEQIIESDPFNVYALVTMAEALITMGSVAQGKEMLYVAENYEKLTKTSFLLALAEVELKNYTQAEGYFKDFCKRSGESPVALFEYANFTELVKDKNTILASYNKLIERYPNTPYALRAKDAIERVKVSSQPTYAPNRKVIPD